MPKQTNEHTSPEVASKAGKQLGTETETAAEKSVAGSALSQAKDKPEGDSKKKD